MRDCVYRPYRSLFLAVFMAMVCNVVWCSPRTEDSLKSLLLQTDDKNEKMQILEQLADRNFGFPKELKYLKSLYNLANTRGGEDVAFKALAISHICRYYFNADKFDSVMVWSGKIDALRLEKSIYSHYFDTKYFECAAIIESGNVEKALGKALELQKNALRLHSEDGEVTCYEMLGDVYMKSKAYGKATDAYVCGYKILKKQGLRATYRFQFLTQILECCHEGHNDKGFSHYLGEMSKIFSLGEIERIQGVLYDRCIKLYYAYALMDGVKRESQADADKYYALLRDCENIDDWFVEGRSASAVADYLTMYGKYEEALNELSKLDGLPVMKYYDLCYRKGLLCEKLHRCDDAVKHYSAAYDSLEAEYNKSMLSEFSQFQELCHKQYASRLQKEYETDRLRRGIILSVAILAIVLVLLLLFVYHVRRSSLLSKNLRNRELQLRADETFLVQRQSVLKNALERHKNNGRMKSMFLSQMSHEIRTPLNAVVGFSSLLLDSAGASAEEREYVRIIRHNSDNLMELVNNVLDLGRLDSNRVAFKWGKYDLMAIIDTALSPYMASAVKSFVESPVEYIEIETDAAQLSKVFAHVYSNAFRFTQEGYVRTKVCVGDDVVKVNVEDSGIGVPDEKRERIFDRFEKVDKFTPGSGLGLSICREIMKSLGGKIYVDKEYYGGLAVVIEIPVRKPKNSDSLL